MDFLYYDYKRKNFSDKHILDKEQELRHLAKLTNEELLINQLTSIGFEGIQVFWRNFNFIGVIAMKLPKNNVGSNNGK
jgi:tRNA (cmo5U34)-methyltransferase